MLPLGISIIDLIIIGVYVFQILWGARLGFAMAAFSLAAEVIGLIAAVLYTPTATGFLNNQFHLVPGVESFVAGHTSLPLNLVHQYNFGTTILQAVVFMILYFGVQAVVFYLGKLIHHQIGVRRMTKLSNSFFGMFVGALKATLEVMFFLIAWNITVSDPNVHASLQQIGGLTNFGAGSKLLPLFQMLLPATSPLAKFF